MAYLDRERRVLRARIVYVGAARAGKSTNLRQVVRQFETTETRLREGVESTIVLGGFVGPYALHGELVTASGSGDGAVAAQAGLLRAADCAIVVCDSTPAGVEAGHEVLRALRASLHAPSGRVPLLVQANKQDEPNALDPAEVARSLDLGSRATVVAACAHRVAGVRETLILALRALVPRAERLLAHTGSFGLGAERSTSVPAGAGSFDASSGSTAPRETPTERPKGAAACEAAAAVPSPDPPLPPDARVESSELWPAPRRDVLRQLARVTCRPRQDLAGRQGADEGSGTSDAYIFQAGDFCLKTSARRRFTSSAAARVAMTRLVRKKQLIEHLVPDDTVVCLRHQPDGSTWLWTIARWVTTLRFAMAHAERHGDEDALGEALVTFATAAIDALALNATRSVVLDVHPSNFGVLGERLCYVDDDIGLGPRNPAIGHALLRRFDEYARFERATQRYLLALQHQIATRLTPSEVEGLEIGAALESTATRSSLAHDAREQLGRMLSRYTAPARG